MWPHESGRTPPGIKLLWPTSSQSQSLSVYYRLCLCSKTAVGRESRAGWDFVSELGCSFRCVFSVLLQDQASFRNVNLIHLANFVDQNAPVAGADRCWCACLGHAMSMPQRSSVAHLKGRVFLFIEQQVESAQDVETQQPHV